MPSPFPKLQYLPCIGAVPGNVYVAPGPGPVIAVAYNGVLMRRGTPGLLYQSFNETGGIITLTFTTEIGDSIYALCVAQV